MVRSLIGVVSTSLFVWVTASAVEVDLNNWKPDYIYSKVNAFEMLLNSCYYDTGTTTTEETTETTTEAPPEKECLGVFNVTAYCPCCICSEGYGRETATGTEATAGRTIAVDPDVIPYGTAVEINGHTYIAEDCGGDIKGNKIDLFVDTHAETLEWGERTLNIYKRKG